MKEVSVEKIGVLRDIILGHADSERRRFESDSRKEADEWVAKEAEKLAREANLIVQDSSKRSEDIRRRQVLSAEREKSTDILRLQNRMLSDALGRLQDRFVHLRNRSDYANILTGVCIDALNSLMPVEKAKFRLSAMDVLCADEIIAGVARTMPDVKFVFDPEPAPILGGCWVAADDDSRQVNLDWQSLTQEMADALAERLLPLL